jgi:hypothetical protein
MLASRQVRKRIFFLTKNSIREKDSMAKDSFTPTKLRRTRERKQPRRDPRTLKIIKPPFLVG